MRVIAELIDDINDELIGAKNYAEKYLQLKAENDSWSAKFKAQSEDELRHAMNVHDYAIVKIEELKRVYTPPTEMQEMWDKEHVHYVEKVAWIKQMLAM